MTEMVLFHAFPVTSYYWKPQGCLCTQTTNCCLRTRLWVKFDHAHLSYNGYTCRLLCSFWVQFTCRPQHSHIAYFTSKIELITTSKQLKVQFV